MAVVALGIKAQIKFLYDASSRFFSSIKSKILREKSLFKIFHIEALALENSKVVEEEIWKGICRE